MASAGLWIMGFAMNHCHGNENLYFLCFFVEGILAEINSFRLPLLHMA